MTKELENTKERIAILRRLIEIEEDLIYLLTVRKPRKGMDKN